MPNIYLLREHFKGPVRADAETLCASITNLTAKVSMMPIQSEQDVRRALTVLDLARICTRQFVMNIPSQFERAKLLAFCDVVQAEIDAIRNLLAQSNSKRGLV